MAWQKITEQPHLVQLHQASSAAAPLVYVCLYQDDSEKLLAACRNLGTPDFHLVTLTNLSWDAELSPWPAGKLFSKEDNFTGKADELLQELTDVIRPRVLGQLSARPVYEVIAGYSLAGLFSLYTAYQTAIFSRIASASGSLWYPDFATYAKVTAFPRTPQAIYLSLGDRESRTRNPYFRRNEEISAELAQFYQEKGITSTFVLNRGNHFQNNVGRLAKGIDWLLKQ